MVSRPSSAFCYTVLVAGILLCRISVTEGASWEKWSSWTSCNATCQGTNYRVRFCLGTSGAEAISACGDSQNSPPTASYDIETQLCSGSCPNTGGDWSTWSKWSQCSTTCEQGVRYRGRHCLNTGCVGDVFDQEACTMPVACFDVDGNWGAWQGWEACSATCGDGFKQRHRVCDSPAPVRNGSDCKGSGTELNTCNVKHCPIDGGWTPFVEHPCTVTCGIGVLVSTRQCTTPPPQYGGKDCAGSTTSFAKCEISCSVNGAWSDWSSWSSCDVVCGDGYIRRSRACDSPSPGPGGADCIGEATSKIICSAGACPQDITICNKSIPTVAVRNISCAEAYNPDTDNVITTYCNAPVDKTKWRLGVEIHANCEHIPLYSPVAILDAVTSSVKKYGVMTECYQSLISIASRSCQDAIVVQNYDLADMSTTYHLILI